MSEFAEHFAAFPDDWKCDVIRRTGGGRDSRGNPLPTTDSVVVGCLLAPTMVVEPGGHSSVVPGSARLYDESDTPWQASDQVITPEGSILPGAWVVDGHPIHWPAGWAIQLTAR